MTVNATDPMIGRLIDGRYQVRSRIARGGMATVYLATDLRLERRVAIKVMHGHLADDNQFKQRFIQEARSAARLAHPNVVNVFDQGQDGDSAYLVMEYLPGITLRELLQEYGTLTPQQTVDIAEAVLSGLAAAHKAGIVHRDLKPENVLLADDGRIKIGDFGLARAASANTATGAALLGTIAYLSPELVTRGIADTRSDIYAVGIIMYEMLTGEQPFKGEQPMQIAYQHANDSVPSPSTSNPKVPAELDELVLWATARDPEQRPRDARAMLEQLHDTERMLRTALPTGATPTQRTMLLPSAPTAATAVLGGGSDAETQVIGGAPGRTSHVPASTESLAVVARKRQGRGWWLILLVLMLAAVSGGTGWYFGVGPGAHATIPDLVGLDPAAATVQLEKLGLEVSEKTGEVHSIDAEIGEVAGTRPGEGASVRKGSEITLLLSLGPKPVDVPALAGKTLDEVRSVFADLGLEVGDLDIRFDADADKDVVMSAARADNGDDLSDGGEYLETGTVDLVVSAGKLPPIEGTTVEQATALLTAADLVVDDDAQQRTYNDSVQADRVIRIAQDGVIRPHDTVSLVVSRGPQPVEVPNVLGMTWSEAKPILVDAGFRLDYFNGADTFPSFYHVSNVSPNVGTTQPKGTTLTINFSI